MIHRNKLLCAENRHYILFIYEGWADPMNILLAAFSAELSSIESSSEKYILT